MYANFSGEITNNTSDISVNKVSLMGFNLPESLYNTSDAKGSIDEVISNYISKLIEKNAGSYDLVKPENGELILKGLLPTSVVKDKKD